MISKGCWNTITPSLVGEEGLWLVGVTYGRL